MADAFTIVANATIVVLTTLTFLEWVRHRDWVRFEIFTPFAALTGLALVAWLWPATESSATFMRAALAVITGIPLVFLRLANRFRSVPRPVEWTALGGYVVLMAYVLPTLPEPTPIGFAAALAFAVVVGVYAAVTFMLGALRTAGVTRNRLVLAAAGAWLLALVVLASSLGAAFGTASEPIDAVVQLGTLGMVLSLYLAFAPPNPVRRWWNATELQRYLDAERPEGHGPWRPLARLAAESTRVAGGLDGRVVVGADVLPRVGGVGRMRPQAVVVRPDTPWEDRGRWLHGEAAADWVRPLWRGADVESVYVVPVEARGPWGTLVVALGHTPLFPDEDLALLGHLARQAARELEDAASLAQLAQNVEELEELNQFKTDFINATAHELANPLVPVRIQLKLLANDVGASERGAKGLGIIRRSVDRLGLIIENMLAAARLQRAKLQIPKEPVALRQVVAEAIESYQDVAGSRDIDLVVEPMDDAEVVGGRLQLAQVVSNLLSNACKYTPQGGRVAVRLARQGGDASFEVADSGIGMTRAQQENVFRAFNRVHSADETDASGTGLGLYISRQLVELHDGRIWCRSDGPGQGSVFGFSLPLAPKVADKRPTASATPAGPL